MNVLLKPKHRASVTWVSAAHLQLHHSSWVEGQGASGARQVWAEAGGTGSQNITGQGARAKHLHGPPFLCSLPWVTAYRKLSLCWETEGYFSSVCILNHCPSRFVFVSLAKFSQTAEKRDCYTVCPSRALRAQGAVAGAWVALLGDPASGGVGWTSEAETSRGISAP